jgi:hypothetical protein
MFMASRQAIIFGHAHRAARAERVWSHPRFLEVGTQFLLHDVRFKTSTPPKEGVMNENHESALGKLVGERPTLIEMPPKREHCVVGTIGTIGNLLSPKELESAVVMEGQNGRQRPTRMSWTKQPRPCARTISNRPRKALACKLACRPGVL